MDYLCLRKMVMLHALRVGLSGQDAEDCASSFVLQQLERQKEQIVDSARGLSLPEHSAAWWHRCAKNYVLNYRRGLARYQQHLNPWYDNVDEPYGQNYTVKAPGSPLTACLQQEAREAISVAFALLSNRTRDLFIAHHIEGISLDLLAQEQGVQPNALSQSLFRARARLRQQLEQRGWTQDEFATALRGDS